jgi:hypothetical protein
MKTRTPMTVRNPLRLGLKSPAADVPCVLSALGEQ